MLFALGMQHKNTAERKGDCFAKVLEQLINVLYYNKVTMCCRFRKAVMVLWSIIFDTIWIGQLIFMFMLTSWRAS